MQTLGIWYIWVDALCIIPDSEHSFNLNARAMHLIHGNAIFALYAADGADARTGLFVLDEDHRLEQWVSHCADGVHLLRSPPQMLSQLKI
ncbi:hypothetical protein J3459_016431 [Metarhizium acridum]|uniref:uncharacterized protein n=1 Tax=Metarhizium acridum TaxID=92637 RepID=UPI001C6C194D|nr:hypothetical protein J3458_020636 [Metarhizium acridum]KAG8411280.1 hypothetical protein J3459_016431 [Metarhizium acridum]